MYGAGEALGTGTLAAVPLGLSLKSYNPISLCMTPVCSVPLSFCQSPGSVHTKIFYIGPLRVPGNDKNYFFVEMF